MMKCPRRKTFDLFHKMDMLEFDVKQWIWFDGLPLLDYFISKWWKLHNI